MRYFYTLCWGVRDETGKPMPHYITSHISRKKALETAKQIHDALKEDRVIYLLESAEGHAVQADHFYLVRAGGGEYVPIRTGLEPMPENAIDIGAYVPKDEDDDVQEEPKKKQTQDEMDKEEIDERIRRLFQK